MNAKEKASLKHKIWEIIFKTDTPTSKFFDVSLLIFIIISIIVVMLETVDSFNAKYKGLFDVIEWILTVAFTIEYGLRIYVVRSPKRYIFSFYGIIDFISLLPSYISIFIAGSESLLILRGLRLLRIFRVFKLGRYLGESRTMINALIASKAKITVFMGTVFTLALIIGAVMYLVEGHSDSGFDSIPRSVYWAIVTITTVGYGDITPVTPLGQFLSAILMLLGYGVIAVPTGIISAEIVQASYDDDDIPENACPSCGEDGHELDARYCKFCGEKLDHL